MPVFFECSTRRSRSFRACWSTVIFEWRSALALVNLPKLVEGREGNRSSGPPQFEHASGAGALIACNISNVLEQDWHWYAYIGTLSSVYASLAKIAVQCDDIMPPSACTSAARAFFT